MFNFQGFHIIQFPSRRWGYVGAVPTKLARMVPADRAAVMGCRSFRHNEQSMMWKFPTFDTEQAARDFAASLELTPVN